MGHYLSEMDPGRGARKAKEEEKRIKARAKKIRKAIDKHGVEYVLAEILEDNTMASIKYFAD